MMLPSKLPPAKATPWIPKPRKPALIAPLSTMLPAKVAPAEVATLLTTMPAPTVAVMAPLLVMPPAKTETKRTAMSVLEAEIAPLLTSPPEKTPTCGFVLVVAPTRMPRRPESAPALLIPPAKVAVFSTATAVPPLASSLLLLSMWMPPMTVPVLVRPPLWKVPWMTTMPPAPMTPVLVTLPVKVVWLTSILLAAVLNEPGYGPVMIDMTDAPGQAGRPSGRPPITLNPRCALAVSLSEASADVQHRFTIRIMLAVADRSSSALLEVSKRRLEASDQLHRRELRNGSGRPRRRRGHRRNGSRQYAAVGASPHAMTHELGRDTPILSRDV